MSQLKSTKPAYIVGGRRTPFTKSFGKYSNVSTQDLMLASVKPLVSDYSLNQVKIGDVALGAVMSSSNNWNLAREVVLGSGLHPHTPAYNVQRACGTSLETTWQLALKIAAGQISEGIAAGVDTNSDLPIELNKDFRDLLLQLNQAKTMTQKLGLLAKIRPSYFVPVRPGVREPRTGLSMGEHCELMVKEWKISRAAQDELALLSHKKAAAAYAEGFYTDLVVEFLGLAQDQFVRADTTLQKLSQLKPAFDKENGTLTAGNSTPLSDGSAAVLLANEESMKKYHWSPQAQFIDAEVAALDFVHGEGLLMAPTVAVSRLLERNNLNLQDFDYYEIHEAFAGQVLCTLSAWKSDDYCKNVLNREKAMGEIDWNKMNIKGGSLAMGHPFAATGARIVASLAKILSQSSGPKARRGLISICTAGGMGVAAILESV